MNIKDLYIQSYIGNNGLAKKEAANWLQVGRAALNAGKGLFRTLGRGGTGAIAAAPAGKFQYARALKQGLLRDKAAMRKLAPYKFSQQGDIAMGNTPRANRMMDFNPNRAQVGFDNVRPDYWGRQAGNVYTDGMRNLQSSGFNPTRAVDPRTVANGMLGEFGVSPEMIQSWANRPANSIKGMIYQRFNNPLWWQ